MKRFILIIFIFFTFYTFAQEGIMMTAKAMTFKYKDVPNDTWRQWKEINNKVYISNVVIRIYGNTDQVYDIIRRIAVKNMIDKTAIVYEAIDEENLPCIVEFVKTNSDKFYLYVRWSNMDLVYYLE